MDITAHHYIVHFLELSWK